MTGLIPAGFVDGSGRLSRESAYDSSNLVPNPWGRINLLFELPSVGALVIP